MKRSSVIRLVIAVMLVTAATMWFVLERSNLDEGGGTYEASPDGHWLAEISDAKSTVHQRSFAVIRLWDLNKYPRLRGGVRYYW